MSNTKNRRVILYMAISVDGFIAGQDSETPWSEEEWVAFQEFVKSCDYCIMGSTTYDIMRKDNSFVPDTNFLVATNNPDKDTGGYKKIVIKSADDLPDGEKIGIIGGAGYTGGELIRLLIHHPNAEISFVYSNHLKKSAAAQSKITTSFCSSFHITKDKLLFRSQR